MVPNLSLVLAINKVKNDFKIKFFLKALVMASNAKEFQEKSVDEFLFGYLDSFVNGLSLPIKDFTKERVGVLGSRTGQSTGNFTIYTGEDSFDNIGKVYAMNEASKLDVWSTDECNQVKGTHESQFPPSSMDKEKILKVFMKSICRTISIKFEEEVILNGQQAWRYRPLPNIFGNSVKNPDNKCYCDAENPQEKCLPSGVFDTEKCTGVSLFVSYPHFYEGDETLLENFEGLKPEADKHASFVDINPDTGIPVGGATRFQLNVRIKQFSYGIFPLQYFFKKLPEDLIIPLCWIELTPSENPDLKHINQNV